MIVSDVIGINSRKLSNRVCCIHCGLSRSPRVHSEYP